MTRVNLKPGQVMPLSRTTHHLPDPVALFEACSNHTRDQVLLESADASTKNGLHTIIMTHAAVRAECRGGCVEFKALTPNGRDALDHVLSELAHCAEVARDGDRAAAYFKRPLELASETARRDAPSPMDALRAMGMRWEPTTSPHPMAQIIPGVFSYDFIDFYEPLPELERAEDDFPDFVFWLPEGLLLLDHQHRRTTAIAHVYGGEHAATSYHDAMTRLGELVSRSHEAPREAEPPVTSAFDVDHEVDIDDEAYARQVRQMKAHIVDGELFQVVLSRTFSAPCEDTLGTYKRLRTHNPSPYMFYVKTSNFTLFGASPETALKVSGVPKRVEIRPIAGTRLRGLSHDGVLDHDLDARQEAALRTDTKEIAEHMMLVDLARNDVARVSAPGTRRVDRLLSVERYAHVMHLVSYVSGALAPELDALHAYVASMNMGTLTGAPKVRAAQLLRQAEGTRRGPYGGAIGYLTHTGDFDSAIIIRSALVQRGKAYIRAGAGIVHDSNPSAEAEETRKKARAVLRALATGGTR